MQRELARDAVAPEKCLKYTLLLLWTVHHALAVRTEPGRGTISVAGPTRPEQERRAAHPASFPCGLVVAAEDCALAVKATMAVLRLLW